MKSKFSNIVIDGRRKCKIFASIFHVSLFIPAVQILYSHHVKYRFLQLKLANEAVANELVTSRVATFADN